MITKNEKDRRAIVPNACDYKNEKEPFEEKGDNIKPNAVRVHDRDQSVRQSISREYPNCQHRDDEDCVNWAGGSGVAV